MSQGLPKQGKGKLIFFKRLFVAQSHSKQHGMSPADCGQDHMKGEPILETPLRQINMQIPRQAMTSNPQQQQRMKLRQRPLGTESQADASLDHGQMLLATPQIQSQQRVVNSLKPVTTRLLNSEQTAKRQINNTQQPPSQQEMILQATYGGPKQMRQRTTSSQVQQYHHHHQQSPNVANGAALQASIE